MNVKAQRDYDRPDRILPIIGVSCVIDMVDNELTLRECAELHGVPQYLLLQAFDSVYITK